MSVPTWKRSTSKSQFLYELYQLNITVGEIMDNQSKKHKDNYSNMDIFYVKHLGRFK